MKVRVGELRRLIKEEYKSLDLKLYVTPPLSRKDGSFVVLIGSEWAGYEHERASLRLKKFLDAHEKYGDIEYGRPEERRLMPTSVLAHHGTLWALPIGAQDD